MFLGYPIELLAFALLSRIELGIGQEDETRPRGYD